MEIRRAQPVDATILSQIARTAKAHWGYPEPWLKQWQEELTITPEFIAAKETFIAILDSQIVAFYALLQTPTEIRLEHFWVLPEQMRRGIGRKLFAHAVGRTLALGATSLTIEADPNAETFYRHLGAIKVGAVETEIEGRQRKLPLLSFDLSAQGNVGQS
jgi:ribosomal protein S18 acetylase RimI-like enzyme